MNKLHKGSVKNNMVRNIMLSLLFLALLPVLVAGYTQAIAVIPPGGWFTDEDSTPTNTFTAGTLMIDVDDPKLFDAQFTGELTSISFDPCAGLSYLVTNTGTKRNYVRVNFEGGWERGFHVNEATAKVTNTSPVIIKSDSAHFRYGNASYSPPSGSTGGVGFTDGKVLGPVEFEPLDLDSAFLVGNFTEIGSQNITDDVFNSSPFNTTANGEVFWIKREASYTMTDSASLSLIKNVFGPECLKAVKVPIGFQDMFDGEVRSEEIGDFKVTIQRQGNSFNFYDSSFPVYHVFVKGGKEKHQLYTYYIHEGKRFPYQNNNEFVKIPPGDALNTLKYAKQHEEITVNGEEIDALIINPLNLSDKGVTAGSGLQQVDGQWSHIVFFYCPKIEIKPEIEIIKTFSLNGGGDWYTDGNNKSPEQLAVINTLNEKGLLGHTINTFYSPTVLQAGSLAPLFKIVVANTGNVNFNSVNVTDDYFSFTYNISLNAGSIWVSPTIQYDDFDKNLPTAGIVTLKIADSTADETWIPSDWHPYDELEPIYRELGEYFYYTEELNGKLPGQQPFTTPLYVNVCLDESNLTKDYNGAVFKLYAYFEAIQVTNQMDEINWGRSVQALE